MARDIESIEVKKIWLATMTKSGSILLLPVYLAHQISACFIHECYSWDCRLFLVLFKAILLLLFRELELEAKCFVANSPTSLVTDFSRGTGAGVLPLSSSAFGVFHFQHLLVDS